MTAKKVPAKSRARTPPFLAYPAWSEAKFWGFVRSGLRATYNKFPVKWEVLKEAKRAYVGTSKQQKWEFKCAVCEQWHKQKDISVDHVIPCGSLNGYQDLAGFVERMFVGPEGLRVLCNVCHQKITNAQRASKKAGVMEVEE